MHYHKHLPPPSAPSPAAARAPVVIWAAGMAVFVITVVTLALVGTRHTRTTTVSTVVSASGATLYDALWDLLPVAPTTPDSDWLAARCRTTLPAKFHAELDTMLAAFDQTLDVPEYWALLSEHPPTYQGTQDAFLGIVGGVAAQSALEAGDTFHFQLLTPEGKTLGDNTRADAQFEYFDRMPEVVRALVTGAAAIRRCNPDGSYSLCLAFAWVNPNGTPVLTRMVWHRPAPAE